jgi:diadenosine tetraphosphate (Ap4A) HIT family hydrolase
LLNNNNKVGDQHIPHVHIHVFIRREGEVSPFDVLSKKVEKVKISEEEWNSRLAEIRSWFE